MTYDTTIYQPAYPEDTEQPLPYCKRCGAILDFEDAPCECHNV